MEFFRLERALNQLVGESITDDRFHGTAGQFEGILQDNNLSAREKAEEIAKIIEERMPNQTDSLKS